MVYFKRFLILLQMNLFAGKCPFNLLSCVDSLQPQELYSPWNSPGQNTGVGSLSLLQGIFQPRDGTQVSCTAGGFFTDRATSGPVVHGAPTPCPTPAASSGVGVGRGGAPHPHALQGTRQASAHSCCQTRSLLVPGPRRTGGPADRPTHGLEGQHGCGSGETPRQLS